MTRARRPDDWKRDLEGARAIERAVGEALRADNRFTGLTDNTTAFDALDFSFTYQTLTVSLDVKEKVQRYSKGVRDLSPRLPERDMFIVDETVFRRIVWQGGGGYLLVRDVPEGRWVVFGPWELTLGPKIRYGRWGTRRTEAFLKGKLLLSLQCCACAAKHLSTDLIAEAVDVSRAWQSGVGPYPIHGTTLRELGN